MFALSPGLLVFLLLGNATAVKDQVCRSHFRSKAYAKAAACFATKVPKDFQRLRPFDRIVIGRRMRNASLSYRYALQREASIGKRAYYREQAIQLLKRYLRYELYESKHRKTSAIVRLHALQEQMIYAPVTVLTRHKAAKVTVTGFHFKHKNLGRWSGQLRPGQYQVKVHYPGHPKARTKRLEIRSQAARVLSFSPPPTQGPAPQKSPQTLAPIAWTLLGLGGLTLAAASLTLGFSRYSVDEAHALNDRRDPNSLEDHQAIDALETRANTLATASLVCWSAGAAALVSGGILLLTSLPKAPKRAQRAPAPSRNTTSPLLYSTP